MMDRHGRQTTHDPLPGATPAVSHGFPMRTFFEFGFLVLAIAPLLHFGISPFLGTFSVVFAAIVLEALPFMLIGSVVSGFLGEFTSQGRILRILSRGGVGTTFIAAALGLFFPV